MISILNNQLKVHRLKLFFASKFELIDLNDKRIYQNKIPLLTVTYRKILNLKAFNSIQKQKKGTER